MSAGDGVQDQAGGARHKADTALYVRDTGGPGHPVVYLNGACADQSHWRRVTADLGSDHRHITYDERARGKSKRSADCSFEGVQGLAAGTSHRSRCTSEKGRP